MKKRNIGATTKPIKKSDSLFKLLRKYPKGTAEGNAYLKSMSNFINRIKKQRK